MFKKRELLEAYIQSLEVIAKDTQDEARSLEIQVELDENKRKLAALIKFDELMESIEYAKEDIKEMQKEVTLLRKLLKRSHHD